MTLWQTFVLLFWVDHKIEKAARKTQSLTEPVIGETMSEGISADPDMPRPQAKDFLPGLVFLLAFLAAAIYCLVTFHFYYAFLFFVVLISSLFWDTGG